MAQHRFSLDEEHEARLQKDMEKADMKDEQDYIRFMLFGEAPTDTQKLFSVEEAVKRALSLAAGQTFTVPELYTVEAWALVTDAGNLGKRFSLAAKSIAGIKQLPRKRHRQTLYLRTEVTEDTEDTEDTENTEGTE